MAINKIFWDIDETLIYTSFSDPNQNHVYFTFDDTSIRGKTEYFTIIRPSALELLAFSRKLVGNDNVYILTTSTEYYANKVNELAGFGFIPDHILHRSIIKNHQSSTAYGGYYTAPCSIANPNNVLIDNLPPRENNSKMQLIGIDFDRYLNVDDYVGVNFTDDPFTDDVKNFLNKLNKLK